MDMWKYQNTTQTNVTLDSFARNSMDASGYSKHQWEMSLQRPNEMWTYQNTLKRNIVLDKHGSHSTDLSEDSKQQLEKTQIKAYEMWKYQNSLERNVMFEINGSHSTDISGFSKQQLEMTQIKPYVMWKSQNFLNRSVMFDINGSHFTDLSGYSQQQLEKTQLKPHEMWKSQNSLKRNVMVDINGSSLTNLSGYPKQQLESTQVVPYEMGNHQNRLKRNIQIDQCKSHLTDVYGYFKEQLKETIKMPYLDITKMCAVSTENAKPLYEIKKAEYMAKYAGHVQEEVMFFTTSAKHAHELARSNFNWRYCSRAGESGNGIVFSNDPEYSNFIYFSQRAHTNVYTLTYLWKTTEARKMAHVCAIMVVKVLKGKCARGYSFMDFPPHGYDTTCDKTGKLFVKFYDHEFLPINVAFFNRPDNTLNKYHPKRVIKEDLQ